jgi:hypothetical protein
MLSQIYSSQLRQLKPAATTAVLRGMESPLFESTRTVAAMGEGFPLFNKFDLRTKRQRSGADNPAAHRATSGKVYPRRPQGLVGIEPTGDHC